MKIAIVGTGISGLAAAYLLSSEHDIYVYESSDYVGGHVNTVSVSMDDADYEIDTGFIVYNDKTYPNFIKLMDRLGVSSQSTSMSFSVKCDKSGLEYNGTSLNGLFAQRINLVKPSFLSMVRDILKFNREAKSFLKESTEEITFGEFLKRGQYSSKLRENYAIPMASAIWSAKPKVIEDSSFRFFAEFFENHGMLNVEDRPQWQVIKGGSKQYVLPLIDSFKERIHLNSPVHKITRRPDGVEIINKNGDSKIFDRVVIATHSDQALEMIENPTKNEREILGAIPYQKNIAVLHWDSSVLPNERRAWASWNYRRLVKPIEESTVTYNMNMLQTLDSKRTFCVSLNMEDSIDPDKVIKKIIYHHPIYNTDSIAAQKRHQEIDGADRIHFCGAYWGFGFHEDGLKSALAVCQQFGKSL
jgi:predicted NAD/FAD-binding protein